MIYLPNAQANIIIVHKLEAIVTILPDSDTDTNTEQSSIYCRFEKRLICWQAWFEVRLIVKCVLWGFCG